MKITYNAEMDSFVLWYKFSDSGDWNIECSVPCMSCDKPSAPPKEYIHYSFLSEIRRLARHGFTLVDEEDGND
jgi:hypothetical protein